MVGQRIKRLREEFNLTQSEFAERIGGTSQQQVHRWENGKYSPSAESITRICDVFNVTADYLLGTEPATPTLDDLTPDERRLILALRSGLLLEVLNSITSITERLNNADISDTD